MRYLLGVLAGIISGLAFTVSSIAQKRAINAIGTEAPLFRNLVKSPLWLAGFAIAFVIGAPLNMAAYMAIGPTLPPVLSSIGLAAVPILARLFLGERPTARSYAGAAVMALAMACLGLSGVAIAPESVDWLDRTFLFRAAITISCVLVASAACLGFGLLSRSSQGASLALAAGAFQALSNALMAPIAGQLGLLFSGSLGLAGLAIAGAASAALAAVNFGAIAVAQLALRRGSAAMILPLQQLPIQGLPIVFHAVLYQRSFGSAAETALLVSGSVFLMAGSLALGRPGKSGKALAAAASLVLMATFPPCLGAQEGAASLPVYRYACLDESGRIASTMDMRVTSGGGEMEVISQDSAGNHGYARLGAGMVQKQVRIEGGGKTLTFRLAANGGSWDVEGCPARSCAKEENAWLGDGSLFFILPGIVDPKREGGEARIILIRPVGGQRTAMRLRAEGIVDAPDLEGKMVKTYRISMELTDPIGRLFWPYKYNYFYRVSDLLFFAYDGPDENRKNSRIVLKEAP